MADWRKFMIQNNSFCEFYKGFKDAITDVEMTSEYLYFKIRGYPVNIDITAKHNVWKSTGVVLPVHPDIDKQLDNDLLVLRRMRNISGKHLLL